VANQNTSGSLKSNSTKCEASILQAKSLQQWSSPDEKHESCGHLRKAFWMH